jgi:integrase
LQDSKPEHLRLFNFEKLNMAALGLARDDLQRPMRSIVTIKGYAADWRMFTRWCDEAGRAAMPATSDTLTLYVTWMLTERKRKVATAERHTSAVAHYHREARLPCPLTEDVRTVLQSVRRRRRERPQGKAALTPEDLQRVAEACDERTNAGARDRALLILGFASSLRRSDLARLETADVSFADQGLIVFVRQGKTDQFGRGRILSVWAGERPATDPVRTIQAWLDRRGTWAGPLFSRVEPYGRVLQRSLSGEAVNDAIKRAIKRAGIDPAPYGAHSLRAGAITAAAIAGGSDQEIMGMSGHVNPAVMHRYVRRARVFAGRNPLAGVL